MKRFIIILILTIIITPIIINQIIMSVAPIPAANSNDWIGFWGSFAGSVISGLITFLALNITINNEKNNRTEERKHSQELREQDRRMQVYPYLTYRIIDSINDIKSFKGEIYQLPPIIPFNISSSHYFNETLNFLLVIKNIGQGIAYKPVIFDAMIRGLKEDLPSHTQIFVNKNDEFAFNFSIVPQPNIDQNKIFIHYNDIFNNCYEQEINIKINIIPQIGGIESKKEYSIRIDDITIPKLLINQKT